ncbi:MAG: hypothetical protein PUF65_11155 [Lachnospiraceae bacterium]|nr:hypothetical protein [Lachnospiraceae bacterium]
MLRVETKKQVIRILKDVDLLCKKAIQQDADVLITILQDVQEAVITVGERVEKEVDDSVDIVSCLESLCEVFYLLSENPDDKKNYGKQIHDILEQVIAMISQMQAGYQIVFFPYKADMWDSLESIWLSCKEDPLCDCKVVPIPYYHFDSEKREWIYQYEIDRFPSYVPVIDYTEYDLEEKADAAFVHNPYDEYNYVTHVHKDYYSYNLKKYVNKLFYVPYYVSTGQVSEPQKVLSVYQKADYLVVQSDAFKEGLKPYPYFDKAIVMGSPKLDRVIRSSGRMNLVPEEWKCMIKGKKSLMLNTSLAQFLSDGAVYLRKIAYIFEVIRQRDDVVLIWRPHPLLKFTIESMRPQLLPVYLKLEQYFIDEKIGILDKTADIINAITIADGYIGEAASSVVNLFEAAGKPLFILDNYITVGFSEEERRRVLLADCEKVGDNYYCTSIESSSIFEVKDKKWSYMTQKVGMKNLPKWLPACTSGTNLQDSIFYASLWPEECLEYNLKKNCVKQISSIDGKMVLNLRFTAAYKDRVFYFPNNTKIILEYNVRTRQWKEYAEPIRALQEHINTQIYEDIYGYFVEDKLVWMTTLYSNRVLCFDMETAGYQIYRFGDESACYSAVAVVEECLYLSDARTSAVEGWDLKTGKRVANYAMPDSYQIFSNIQGCKIAHLHLISAGKQLIAVPFTANGLVSINLETNEVALLAEEFFEDVLQEANGYSPEAHGTVNFAKKMDANTLLLQKRRDGALLELNLSSGEYHVYAPKLAPEEFAKLLDGEDGFEKSYTYGEFARRESRYFPFEEFLDDLVNERLDDAMARQKEAIKTIAVNLDGTCGEKVHEFMMDVLMHEG